MKIIKGLNIIQSLMMVRIFLNDIQTSFELSFR